MSESEQKTYPTHRISFSEKQVDDRGQEKLGQPVEVAAVWPRKNGKHGGIIEWKIAPERLQGGVFFMLENERQQNRNQSKRDGFDQSDARSEERANVTGQSRSR